MKIVTLVLLVLFGTNHKGKSQNYMNSLGDPIAKAKELSDKYSTDDNKEEMGSLYSIVEYDFSYKRKDKTDDAFHTQIDQKEQHHLIALKNDVSAYQLASYDNESEIEDYGVYKGKGLRKEGYMNRNCYSNISESILSSDMVYCQFNFEMESKGDLARTEINKRFKNVRYFTSVYFRSHFPIEEKVIVFKIPDWLEIDFHEINFEGYDIEKTEKKITTSEKFTEYRYVVKNLRSTPDEDFMPGATYFEPHIAINVKNINHDKNVKPLFATNDDVYAWYKLLTERCNNESVELEEFTSELIKEESLDEEKIKKIYYWLQDNIRYIAYEDGLMGFQPENARDVYSQKYGDCKGMANLAKTMLTYAGFDARLTWIGTNRIGSAYDYSFPSLANDNHMICTLMKDEQEIFLDPTETFIQLGEYADRIQGRKVMIEDDDSYIISTVPEADISRNRVEDKWSLRIDGNVLRGKVHNEYNGDRKVGIMNSYARTKSQDKEDALKSFLEGNDKNIQVSNCVSEGLENRDIPISFTYDLAQQNAILNVNDDLYLSLEMDRNFSQTDVNVPREMDIYFGSKVNNVLEVKLDIPEGYQVDYLPEALNIKSEDYEITGEYKEIGSQVIYKRTIIVSQGKVSKGFAEEWNDSIGKLNELYDDQVVLKRKK